MECMRQDLLSALLQGAITFLACPAAIRRTLVELPRDQVCLHTSAQDSPVSITRRSPQNDGPLELRRRELNRLGGRRQSVWRKHRSLVVALRRRYVHLPVVRNLRKTHPAETPIIFPFAIATMCAAMPVREPTIAGYRTTRTEQELCCTIFVDTLPSKNRATAPMPLAPVTMRSTFFLDATSRISLAGLPSRTSSSTT